MAEHNGLSRYSQFRIPVVSSSRISINVPLIPYRGSPLAIYESNNRIVGKLLVLPREYVMYSTTCRTARRPVLRQRFLVFSLWQFRHRGTYNVMPDTGILTRGMFWTKRRGKLATRRILHLTKYRANMKEQLSAFIQGVPTSWFEAARNNRWRVIRVVVVLPRKGQRWCCHINSLRYRRV